MWTTSLTPRLAAPSTNGFASEALCALVAVIGAVGERAGRPRSDKGGRALLMLEWAAAFHVNFKLGARPMWVRESAR